jgi:hypothetical protein
MSREVEHAHLQSSPVRYRSPQLTRLSLAMTDAGVRAKIFFDGALHEQAAKEALQTTSITRRVALIH